MKSGKKVDYGFTLVIFSILFFFWGFLTSLNGNLISQLNLLFDLNDFRESLISFTFFATYFFVALVFYLISLKKDLLALIGYKYLTVMGLSIAAIGAFLFYPASTMISFPFFMFALVVLASGITILQLAANTYIVSLIEDGLGHSRLNLVQALNSLGATLGPFLGSVLMINTLNVSAADMALLSGEEIYSLKKLLGAAIQLPYWLIATSLFMLAALVFFVPMPDLVSKKVTAKSRELSEGINRNIWMATIGIFVYVGAEVTIGANLGGIIEKLHPDLLEQKAFLCSAYWALAMIGRFVGGGLMRYVNGGLMLLVFGLAAVFLVSLAVVGSGDWTVYALVLVGFCNSIMFPTIYASGLYELHDFTGKGASMLIMAIAGGALIPAIYSIISPFIGAQHSLVIAALCYGFIAYYGRSYFKISVDK